MLFIIYTFVICRRVKCRSLTELFVVLKHHIKSQVGLVPPSLCVKEQYMHTHIVIRLDTSAHMCIYGGMCVYKK